jgi:hypothetical protein
MVEKADLAMLALSKNNSQCDMFVTGHLLGGTLSTLFVMLDIGPEFGIDEGQALPQLDPSEH